MPTDKEIAGMTDEQLKESLVEQPSQPSSTSIPPQTEPPKVPTMEELLAKISNLEKRVTDKDVMIGRQGNEIGDLKKKVQGNPPPPIPKPTPEEFFTDPSTATEKVLFGMRKQEEDARTRYNEQVGEWMGRNQALTEGLIPEFSKLVPEIKDMLINDDKYDPQIANAFATNPYLTDAITLIQLGKRLQMKKEWETAKNRLEELEKKPGKILKKIETASRSITTSKAGQVRQPISMPLSDKQISEMSDDELKTSLAEDLRNETAA